LQKLGISFLQLHILSPVSVEMLYVVHALSPWKYVICVTNAAFMT